MKIKIANSTDYNSVQSLLNKFARQVGTNKTLTKNLCDNQMTLLMLDSNKLIGTIGFVMSYQKIEIVNFVIDKPYQNKGYGKKLLKECISYASKAYVNKIDVIIEAKKENILANIVYLKLGELIGTTKECYVYKLKKIFN